MENRKRNVQIIVRVTEEERALIEEKMKQIPTINLSAYSRKMLIDGYIIVLDLQEVKAYYAKRDEKAIPDKPYQWSAKSVAGILERPEYIGCTVNFKTYSKSHKLKKRLNNAPENYRIFSNTQPAIVNEKVWQRVQELRENKRRPAKTGKQGLFSGIVRCADCGSKQRFNETEKAVKRRNKELEQAKKRITELDRIFKRIYEDDITGAISHERFLKLSAEYEAEQKELTEFVKTEQAAVDTYEQDRADFDSFAAIIRKYVGIKELTPTIVNEFVKKIIVHAPDKSSGHRRQKIQIVWNFIGELEQNDNAQTIERQRKSRAA